MSNKPFETAGVNLVSPKGEALWCKHIEPDRKFDTEGILSCDLVVDPGDPAVEAYLEKLQALQDDAYNQTVESLGPRGKQVVKADLFKEHYDKDGNPTGMVVFKYKLGKIDARASRGQRHTIDVVDAHRNALENPPLVGNGSIVRMAAFVFPYYMASTKQIGLSMMWSKMQIIDLVEYGNSKSSEFDDEDGFTASAAPKAAPAPAPVVEDDDDF